MTEKEFEDLIAAAITVPYTQSGCVFISGIVSLHVESSRERSVSDRVTLWITTQDAGLPPIVDSIAREHRHFNGTTELHERSLLSAIMAANVFSDIVRKPWNHILNHRELRFVHQSYAHRCLENVSGKESFLRLMSDILGTNVSYKEKTDLISLAFYSAAIRFEAEEEMTRLMAALELMS